MTQWKHQFKSPRKEKDQRKFWLNETPKHLRKSAEMPPIEQRNFQDQQFQMLSLCLKHLEDRGACLFTSGTLESNDESQFIAFLDIAANESLDEYSQSFICTGIRTLLESRNVVHSIFIEKEILNLNKCKDKELNKEIKNLLSNDAWNTSHLLMMTTLIDHALNSIRMDPDRFKDTNAFNFLAGELSFLVFPRDNYEDQSMLSSMISSSMYFSLERRRRRAIKRILRSLLFKSEHNNTVRTTPSKRRDDVICEDRISEHSDQQVNVQKTLFEEKSSDSNTSFEYGNYFDTQEFSNEVKKLISQDAILLENSRLRIDRAISVLNEMKPDWAF
ncbi:predicted protein [Chaetoceros tenuissimus]|uniref:Uncharacterized protein n=1 Tax=Chaetoceros tenuissimus TaxID=426638 RepID=A0AAD3CTB3_9STRA|nr:predicted protein [Chaetoceros tenuissimus]